MVATPLRDAVVSVFTRLSHDGSAIDELRPLYAHDVRFVDPIQAVVGVDEFIAINQRLAARARGLSFLVDRVVGDDAEFFLTWRLRVRPRIGPLLEVDGVSHLTGRDGKVQAHRDYWDLANFLASGVPGGERLLRFALKPLA